jgi:hypothetical protein
VQHFLADFFHKKMHQQIGREDSIQTGCRRMRKLEGLLNEAAENFELFLKFKIKILKFRTFIV